MSFFPPPSSLTTDFSLRSLLREWRQFPTRSPSISHSFAVNLPLVSPSTSHSLHRQPLAPGYSFAVDLPLVSPSTFHSLHRQPLAPGYSFAVDLPLVRRQPYTRFTVNLSLQATRSPSISHSFASQSTGAVEVLPSFELERHIRLSRNLSGSGILYVCTSTPSTVSAKHRDPPSIRQTAQADAAEALILSVEGCLPVSPFGQGSCSG